jgi:ATP-dependent DNA helicase RecG
VAFQRGYDVTSGRKNVVSDVVSLSVVQLTDRQKKICELIKENPFISSKQMSVVLSVDSRTVQRDLSALQKKGILIREGNTSAGHWVVMV